LTFDIYLITTKQLVKRNTSYLVGAAISPNLSYLLTVRLASLKTDVTTLISVTLNKILSIFLPEFSYVILVKILMDTFNGRAIFMFLNKRSKVFKLLQLFCSLCNNKEETKKKTNTQATLQASKTKNTKTTTGTANSKFSYHKQSVINCQ